MPDNKTTVTQPVRAAEWHAKNVERLLGPNCRAAAVLRKAAQLRASGREATVVFALPKGWHVLSEGVSQ